MCEKGLSEKETLGLKELFKQHQEACQKFPSTIFDFLAIAVGSRLVDIDEGNEIFEIFRRLRISEDRLFYESCFVSVNPLFSGYQ